MLHVSFWDSFSDSSRNFKNAAPDGQMTIPFLLPWDMESSPPCWKCIGLGRTLPGPVQRTYVFFLLPRALVYSCVRVSCS